MTNAIDLIEYVDRNLWTPVLKSNHASIQNRRRVLTERMRFSRLPVGSIARSIDHAAACDTPSRIIANEQLERQGFVSYRQMLPSIRERFPDIFSWD